MLGEARLNAGRALSPTALERSGQRTAAVKDQQIARLQKVADMVKARVCAFAALAVNHQKAHLVAGNPAAFGRLFGGKLRRQTEGKGSSRHNEHSLNEIAASDPPVSSVAGAPRAREGTLESFSPLRRPRL